MRADLRAAAEAAGVADRIRLVRTPRHAAILARIAETFATRTPWWEHLRGATHFAVEDGRAWLAERLPDAEVWLVVEDFPTTGNRKAHGDLWLLEGDASAALALLAELHFVEYYLVDRKMTWMLGENHHGIVFEVAAGG